MSRFFKILDEFGSLQVKFFFSFSNIPRSCNFQIDYLAKTSKSLSSDNSYVNSSLFDWATNQKMNL